MKATVRVVGFMLDSHDDEVDAVIRLARTADPRVFRGPSVADVPADVVDALCAWLDGAARGGSGE